MLISEPPVIVTEIINTSVEKAWMAITDHQQMIQWYFDNIDAFKPEVGTKSRFPVHVEDRTFTHLWKVTEVIPNKKITYNWKYAEYPGDSFVTFELAKDGDATQITLSTKVVEDFPQDVPEFNRDSCLGGWNYFIKERLKPYLES